MTRAAWRGPTQTEPGTPGQRRPCEARTTRLGGSGARPRRCLDGQLRGSVGSHKILTLRRSSSWAAFLPTTRSPGAAGSRAERATLQEPRRSAAERATLQVPRRCAGRGKGRIRAPRRAEAGIEGHVSAAPATRIATTASARPPSVRPRVQAPTLVPGFPQQRWRRRRRWRW